MGAACKRALPTSLRKEVQSHEQTHPLDGGRSRPLHGDVDFIDCTFDVKGANYSDGYPEGLQAINCTFELENCTNVNGALEDLFSTGYGGVYNVK